ncbi:hypothetical protein LQ757_07365 [Agromyces sp. SYSU K20354]|uniref:hypothetical protein n=1 Tax=Agromyces cavernae TaxID=2898659 RepID=UPI001E58E31E|nr:hypothetical protein [Agromyces cavernae]MCD2442095.1 hypothetical protein [Agromyces cavernae]
MRRTTRPAAADRSAPEGPSITTTTERSLAGYRLLRRIATGDRADVFLATVDRAESDAADAASLVAVRVYTSSVSGESIATEIEAMAADTSESLPALYDVAALDDGRCCLAVERMPGPTLAGLLLGRTLDPGEAVTILAPIVVAVAELAATGYVHTRLSANDVIIDAAGRPRIIGLGALQRMPGPGNEALRTDLMRTGHEVLADLIGDVVQATRPAGVFDEPLEIIRAALATRPFVACERAVERALFDAATPTPITGVAVRPRRTALPGRMMAPQTPQPDAPAPEETPRRSRRGALSVLAEIAQLPVPVPSADRVAEMADRDHAATLVGRLRRRLAARRRPVLVGGLIGGAALVMLLTLVPPAPADEGTAAEPASTPQSDPEAPAAAEPSQSSASATNDGSKVPVSDAEAEPDLDAVSAAAHLLELRASCLASLDQACLAQVAQPDSAIERADLDLLAQARSGSAMPPDSFALDAIAVTAEMGSAVLLSVPYLDAQREPASLLVMRGEAGWRLRELFG